MKTRKSMLAGIALSALLMTACDENGLGDGTFNGSNNRVAFSLPQKSHTRSAQHLPALPLTVGSKQDTLWLISTVEPLPEPVSAASLTRGTPATTDNFATLCGGFYAVGYNGATEVLPVAKFERDANANGLYTHQYKDESLSWPKDNGKVMFYLWASPAGTEDVITYTPQGCTNMAFAMAASDDQKPGGSLSFDYSMPSTGGDDDAANQQDIVFTCQTMNEGEAKTFMEGSKGKSILFYHALAGVKFKLSDDILNSSEVVVTKVELKNVVSNGHCTVTPNYTDANVEEGDNKSNQTGVPNTKSAACTAWTGASTTAYANYTQSFTSDEQNAGDENNLNTSALEKTFFVVPQTFKSEAEGGEKVVVNTQTAEIAITYRYKDQIPQTVSCPLTGQTWEAGGLYTYTLSFTPLKLLLDVDFNNPKFADGNYTELTVKENEYDPYYYGPFEISYVLNNNNKNNLLYVYACSLSKIYDNVYFRIDDNHHLFVNFGTGCDDILILTDPELAYEPYEEGFEGSYKGSIKYGSSTYFDVWKCDEESSFSGYYYRRMEDMQEERPDQPTYDVYMVFEESTTTNYLYMPNVGMFQFLEGSSIIGKDGFVKVDNRIEDDDVVTGPNLMPTIAETYELPQMTFEGQDENQLYYSDYYGSSRNILGIWDDLFVIVDMTKGLVPYKNDNGTYWNCITDQYTKPTHACLIEGGYYKSKLYQPQDASSAYGGANNDLTGNFVFTRFGYEDKYSHNIYSCPQVENVQVIIDGEEVSRGAAFFASKDFGLKYLTTGEGFHYDMLNDYQAGQVVDMRTMRFFDAVARCESAETQVEATRRIQGRLIDGYTLEIAFCMDKDARNSDIYPFGGGLASHGLQLIIGGSTPQIHFLSHGGSGDSKQLVMNDTFVKGQWYHIVISCASNGLIKTYVNGIEENQWTNQSGHCFYEGNLTKFRMCIGGDMSVDNLEPSEYTRACESPFPGYIAVTRIYEDTLTVTQSKGLFTKFMAGQ